MNQRMMNKLRWYCASYFRSHLFDVVLLNLFFRVRRMLACGIWRSVWNSRRKSYRVAYTKKSMRLTWLPNRHQHVRWHSADFRWADRIAVAFRRKPINFTEIMAGSPGDMCMVSENRTHPLVFCLCPTVPLAPDLDR
jgi:hypothetical protein